MRKHSGGVEFTAYQEWLEARKKGIGASDAACVLGLNPWKSNTKLWEEKTGRLTPEDIGHKPAVKYGKESEAHLRNLFALDFPQYRVSHDEFGMIANIPKCPWLFATLDGELELVSPSEPTTSNQRLGVLEIKTTEIMRQDQWEQWNGRVPDHYYCQILHQLLATGYGFAILKAQIKYRDYIDDDPETSMRITTRHYRFDANNETVSADMQHLLKKEIEFWGCVQSDRMPPQILPQI
ncbi:YqaJ viral recombinase family protein [Ruminococcaceae bacterium OttesenSCG-928-A16]|nr:YqaJ viral recombinase family protein [Ruminococcaceae bacterium OttesenSCG-928-A16]